MGFCYCLVLQRSYVPQAGLDYYLQWRVTVNFGTPMSPSKGRIKGVCHGTRFSCLTTVVHPFLRAAGQLPELAFTFLCILLSFRRVEDSGGESHYSSLSIMVLIQRVTRGARH